MNFFNNVKNAVSDPVLPYNSLYIDIAMSDALKALSTPRIMSHVLPFAPLPWDRNIKCFGCRVRQIHGVDCDPKSNNDYFRDQSDEKLTKIDPKNQTFTKKSTKLKKSTTLPYESCNDIHHRLQGDTWTNALKPGETANNIQYDLASLWARPYINNTSQIPMSSPKTIKLSETNPLCKNCSLQSQYQAQNDLIQAVGYQKQQQAQQSGSQSLQIHQQLPQSQQQSSQSQQTPPSLPPPQTTKSLQNHYTPPPHSYNVLPMLSVRSALTAWLLLKDFPKGSIVIFSAVNIPDMAKVIKAHDLIPLPIDLDTNTTLIDIDCLEKTIQHYGVVKGANENNNENNPKKPKICAVIISYIFGIRNDISQLINTVHKYDLPLIEDCAEAYTDVNFVGHPDADLSLFSFGSIKNCTAFGGGIARVKSFEDYVGMIHTQSLWPRYTNTKYFEKVRKMLPLSLILNRPFCSETAIRCAKAVNIDIKELAVKNLRGFPGEMIFGVRHQPPPALIFVLRHRIATATNESLTKSAQVGLQFEGFLQKYNVNIEIVGQYAESRGYWLFPFIVSDPETITNDLSQRGVQVYRGATQLACLQVPDELLSGQIDAKTTIPGQISYAKELMNHVIYLPLSKAIPFYAMDTIAKHLRDICGEKKIVSGGNIVHRSIISYPPVEPGIVRKSQRQLFDLSAARL
jgi:dTDP-4-amino-4,6-dideoxygalactose transaminase